MPSSCSKKGGSSSVCSFTETNRRNGVVTITVLIEKREENIENGGMAITGINKKKAEMVE